LIVARDSGLLLWWWCFSGMGHEPFCGGSGGGVVAFAIRRYGYSNACSFKMKSKMVAVRVQNRIFSTGDIWEKKRPV